MDTLQEKMTLADLVRDKIATHSLDEILIALEDLQIDQETFSHLASSIGE